MPDENEASTPERTPPADANANAGVSGADVMSDDAMAAAMRAAIDEGPAKEDAAASNAAATEPVAQDGAAGAESSSEPDDISTTVNDDDAAASGAAAEAPLPSGAVPFTTPDVSRAQAMRATTSIDLLDDVELDVKIELGRAEMYIEDVLELGPGSVVKLDKAAGDPVDIFVNERLVARGEVLVLNDNFCVRINDILSPIPEA